MKRFAAVVLAALAVAAFVFGCAKVEEKTVLIVTDLEGDLEPREITVGYVNERMSKVPGPMLPMIEGDEGKLAFLEDIKNKELLVSAGLKAGIDKSPEMADLLERTRQDKASSMLEAELILNPGEVSEQEVERYYELRDMRFTLQQMTFTSREPADEAYRRVTEGGEGFGKVCVDMSEGANAKDKGIRPTDRWVDLHPLVRRAIADLEKGDITPPIEIGETYHIYKILSKKPSPEEQKPLEGNHLHGITYEARVYKRELLQRDVYVQWIKDANVVYSDENVALAAERIGDVLDEVMPENLRELPFEERLEYAHMKIVPEFSEAEAVLPLVSFVILGEEHSWTLGDFARELDSMPGMETPKSADPRSVRGFVARYIHLSIRQAEIERRGYMDSAEMAEYLERKGEEYLVNLTYQQEIAGKVPDPIGGDVRAWFRANREKFKEPESVDIRQIIVGTEAEANAIIQRLNEGSSTFADLVMEKSTDEWSRAKKGIIKSYYKGEKRLGYLQDVVFDLDVDEISQPFRAPGGYAVVKVLAKYPERLMESKELGDRIREAYIAEQTEEVMQAFLERMRGQTEFDVVEENLQYVTDPLELAEEYRNSGRRLTIETPVGIGE